MADLFLLELQFLTLPGPVLLLLTVLLLVFLIGKEFIPNKVIPLVLNLLWMAAAMAAALFVSFALTAPLVQIIQQLS